MYLWLVAAGLTIAFGILRILNFAHGSLYMLGAYFAFTLYYTLKLNFWLSMVLAAALVGVVGLILERFLFRRIYPLEEGYQLILTFGIVLILSDAAKLIWGGVFMIPPMPDMFVGTVVILDRPFPVYNLFVICAGLAVTALIWLLLERGWWGKMVRATASDREMAGALGINTPTLFSIVFLLAAALAGLGGALSIPVRVVAPGVGTAIIVQAFVVTVIGGLGNLKGAFLGALIVGLANAYGILLFPTIELFLIYLLMAVVLLVRPKGLLGG
ncbi:hypothetical protein SY88_13865 [Clostridiales bacterium PH28_bin88]|nr:hypothetical protein SY88_13865 [Clostridiales bacterium PH28_bin88]